MTKIASNYSTRFDFQKGDKSAYEAARCKGLLEKICKHMGKSKARPWSVKECLLEAAKYDNRARFQARSKAVYEFCRQHGWLDKVCTHMSKDNVGKKKMDRFLYILYRKNLKTGRREAYVGITMDIEIRLMRHQREKPRFFVDSDIVKTKVVVKGPYSQDLAPKKEIRKIAKLKNLGYEVKNIDRGGSLGCGYSNRRQQREDHTPHAI